MTSTPEPSIRPHDRILFFGDSITEQRMYTNYVETFLITRYPTWGLRFINSGWGGDKTWGGALNSRDVRVARDVVAHQPTVITVMFGMNDAGYVEFSRSLYRKHQSNFYALADAFDGMTPKPRVTIIQPSAYDDVTRTPSISGGYNNILLRFGEVGKRIAQDRGYQWVDFNTPFNDLLRRVMIQDLTAARNLLPDRVHPTPSGHLIMAQALLTGWNVRNVVSSVDLDASAKRVANAGFTTVRDFDGRRWTQLDESLPFPVVLIPDLAVGNKFSDFQASLNSQPLRVSGLGSGDYDLLIDGASVGTWSAEQLAEGIDLAGIATPMTKQALEVHDLTNRRSLAWFQSWRGFVFDFKDFPASARRVQDEARKVESELVKKQARKARPVVRHYELRLSEKRPGAPN